MREFITSKEVADVVRSFRALLATAGVTASSGPSILPALRGARVDFSVRSFLDAVTERAAQSQYTSLRCDRVRATVVGAGPVGLRCAIELALLGAEAREIDARSTRDRREIAAAAGAQVHVLEGRRRFSRLNALYLWEWVQVATRRDARPAQRTRTPSPVSSTCVFLCCFHAHRRISSASASRNLTRRHSSRRTTRTCPPRSCSTCS